MATVRQASGSAREFTDGSTAIVRAAIAAGCDFFAGYPITPASPILTMMMKEMPKIGGIAIQGEDEIASIGMCIGATMTGARAMTATSGPGISLCSENIGLAIMGEVPLVIVDVQRLGPGTGGATTVGQGDVQFLRWGTAGGYPVIVLAPSSVHECYGMTSRAFDLAERFRCPVFLLTDKELDLTANTVAADGYPEFSVRVRELSDGADARPYRFEPADTVAPMMHFGGDTIVRFTGSTHDERGFITANPSEVNSLNEHLAAKIDEHLDEIEMVVADLEEGAKTLLISYGITAGSMREAVRNLREGGCKVSALTLQSLWPVPQTSIIAALKGVERVVVAELNLGQYRLEIERIAGDVEILGVNRVDGELIAPEQLEEVVR